MGVRSFGAGTQKARQAGADLAQQMGYGAASASVEVLTEKMFDGLAGIYGKGFADGVVEGIVDKLAKGRLGPQAVKLISGMSEEAIEELVAGMVDPMLENLYDPKEFGTRYKDPDTYAEIGYGMLIGGLMGGIGTGGQLLVNNAINARANAANITSPGVENETAAPWAGTTAVNENTRLTDDDLNDYMKVGGREHVRNTKAAQVKAGSSPILTSVKAIKDFIRSAINGKTKDTIKAYGKVGNRLANAVAVADRNANGNALDIKGYYLELEANHLSHLSDHIESDADTRNIPLTEEQAESIPDYIDTFDDVIEVMRKKDGGIRIKIGKKINGHAIIIEAVSKGRQSLHPITAWQIPTKEYNRKYSNEKTDGPIDTSQRAEPPISGYKPQPSVGSTVSQAGEKSNTQNQGPNLQLPTLEEYVRQMYGDNETAKGIDMAQAGAQRELALAKSRLQSRYEAALTQARASGNADLANALYKELLRIQKLERGNDR